MDIDPHDIDIRLAVGSKTRLPGEEPRGNQAIKMICPMHRERLGVEDDVGSLAVYRANLHCFGCGFHIRRRYAALAFLLGVWDGRGSEDGERCQAAVRQVKARLQDFVGDGGGVVREAYVPPPPDPIMVEAFHQFLLTELEDSLVDELMVERGLSLESVIRYRLGHTGTHFTLPVYDLDGSLVTVRYRADDRMVDPNEPGYRKYEGTWGHNSPLLYPMPVLSGLSAEQAPLELWVVEGEFDAISVNQAGNVALTVTNGATSLDKLPGMLADLMPTLLIGRWVIATDQDKAGDQAAIKLRSVLSGQSVVRARWGWGKDLTEYYAAGGSRRKIEYVQGAGVL